MSEELLLLAYGIGEWQTALDHMDALRRAGITVPYVVSGRAADELNYLCLKWSNAHGEVLYDRRQVSRVVAEARTFCTTHMADIELLIREKEEREDNHEEDLEG